MKKFISLSFASFLAATFIGCAAMEMQPDVYDEPEPAPEPVRQAKPMPKPKPKPKPARETPAPARSSVPEIITNNLYPIPKFVNVDNDFTIVSLTPVSYSAEARCNEVNFFAEVVTAASGYHNLVDISMSETRVGDKYSCKYFGSAVVYKIKPNPFVTEVVKYEDVVRKYVPEQ